MTLAAPADAPLARSLLQEGGGDSAIAAGVPVPVRRAVKASIAGLVLLTLGTLGGFGAGRASLRAQGQAHLATLLVAPGALWTPDQPGVWEDSAFETRIRFQMPYMDFVEDIYVHSDKLNGLMKLTYYSGADVFLINTTGHSYELVPVDDRESCLVTASVHHVELVVPDLELFRKHGSHRQVTLVDTSGIESVGHEFTLNLMDSKPSPDSHWEYYKVFEGFEGVYKLFVNASSGGIPLNVTFHGHNPFLVQSHSDEYHVIYQNFYLRPDGIDPFTFMPPQGMYCQNYYNPTGPFKQGPLTHNIALAMPGMRGESARHSVLREMWAHFQKSCGEDCSARQRQALRRYRWTQAMNRRGGNYKVGINHMFDWTTEEQRAVLGRRPVALDEGIFPDVCEFWQKNTSALELPQHLDWREHGEVVGPPRDQATCGSCWAFAAIGMVEGQVARKFGTRTRLSEQHLLDCSWSFGTLACDGGNDASALSWALQHNGGQIATEETYGHYLSENGFCHFDMSRGLRGLQGVAATPPGAALFIDPGAQLHSCWHVPGPEQAGGMNAGIQYLNAALVDIGPISVSIQASRQDFYFYSSGIYDNPACLNGEMDSDHVVLAVGFGRSHASGQAYWLLRNSWSANWGEAGYVRVAKEGNICGVATSPVFALLGPHNFGAR